MDRIFDELGLYVNINDKRIAYKRIYLGNNIPDYFPTDYLFDEDYDYSISRCIFLPIDSDTFKSSAGSSYCGYIYSFTDCRIQPIMLGDPVYRGEAFVQTQFISRVNRFLYTILTGNEIRIENIFDPLFPDRIMDITGKPSDVGMDMLSVMKQLMDEYNSYYLTNEP